MKLRNTGRHNCLNELNFTKNPIFTVQLLNVSREGTFFYASGRTQLKDYGE